MHEKNKRNALKLSARNKFLKNRQIKIKFCNKKCMAQAYQNVNANGIETIKRACQVKLCESQINKIDCCNSNLEIFRPLILCAFENQFNQSICKTKILF